MGRLVAAHSSASFPLELELGRDGLGDLILVLVSEQRSGHSFQCPPHACNGSRWRLPESTHPLGDGSSAELDTAAAAVIAGGLADRPGVVIADRVVHAGQSFFERVETPFLENRCIQ